MNLDASSDLNFGSGRSVEALAVILPISHQMLGLLGSVPAAGLLAVGDAQRIANATDNLIAHTRQVANTTAAHEDDRVLLQIVTFARNVNRHFAAGRKPHAGDLAQRG